MAIGARSQSARTYLEKHLNEFPDCTTEDLVRHGLRALRDTLPNEVELTSKVKKRFRTKQEHIKNSSVSIIIITNYRTFRLDLSEKVWISLFTTMKGSSLS